MLCSAGDSQMENMDEFKGLIVGKLQVLSPRPLQEEYRGRAAVLVPIFFQGSEPWLLLTLRSQEVATHKGQISFPGGLQETCDASVLQTALRETEEELGIGADFIQVAGQFHDYLAVTHCAVTPFVGFLRHGFSMNHSAREVQSVVNVPLEFFLDHEPRREWLERLGKRREVLYYDFQGHLIWGLTARIIHDFLALVGDWRQDLGWARGVTHVITRERLTSRRGRRDPARFRIRR